LIGPGGKVNPAAVFRAAQDRAPTPPPSMAPGEASIPDPGDDDSDVEALDASGTVEAPGVLPVPLDPFAGVEDALPTGFVKDAPRAQTVTFNLQRDLQKRLDKYLTDRITFMSRSKLQDIIDGGGVLVNGRVAKCSTVLRVGDRVEVSVPPPPSEDFEPQDIPLDVLFEDEHLIVLNKGPDIIVHPARTHTHGTLINALAFHFRNRSPCGGGLSRVGIKHARPGVVHRLDRKTTGVIVFAKSDQAHWQLARQFMERTVEKRYLAIAQGRVRPAVEVVDLPIGPHPSREKGYREVQVVRHDELGKPAVTIWRVLAWYSTSVDAHPSPRRAPAVPAPPVSGWKPPLPATTRALPGPPAGPDTWSLVEVELKTGRTHQIRLHLSHQGFPLAGDDMYGGRYFPLQDESEAARSRPDAGVRWFKRQALHAAVLAFRHPITGAPMRFTAPFPPDLSAVLARLRSMPVVVEDQPAPGATIALADLVPTPPAGPKAEPARG
jgi:23S rRNA pseudouridine1911/1915/1917 synthase